MILCESCGRHHKVDESACPFCARKSSPTWKAFQLMSGVVTTAVLTACYGPPAGWDSAVDSGGNDSGTTVTDLDEDGVSPPEDCDDGNPAVNPSAVEVCDNTIDDDCDGATDGDDTDCQTTE